MKNFLVFGVLVLLVGCSADEPAFLFSDQLICDDGQDNRVFEGTSFQYDWDGSYINAVVETNLNCAEFAQKPSYQVEKGVMNLHFETLSPEGESALCECGHRIRFRVRSNRELPVNLLIDGAEFRSL